MDYVTLMQASSKYFLSLFLLIKTDLQNNETMKPLFSPACSKSFKLSERLRHLQRISDYDVILSPQRQMTGVCTSKTRRVVSSGVRGRGFESAKWTSAFFTSNRTKIIIFMQCAHSDVCWMLKFYVAYHSAFEYSNAFGILSSENIMRKIILLKTGVRTSL